ncbi:MAG TPA: hypothetical protein VH477_10610, partial [Bryobacteraceae bacterium]
MARRPPTESAKELTALVNRSPERGDLYALRAAENERQLNINGAESDWKRAAELATDKAHAVLDLADFYHRRLQPDLELQTLLRAVKLPAYGLDRFRPDHLQFSWRTFERAADVAKQARLGSGATDDVYQSWIERYPDSSEPYAAYLNVLRTAGDLGRAQALAERITAQFRSDIELQTETEAKVAAIEGGSAAELAMYSRHFSPLWPVPVRKRYFELLTAAHAQRRFLADARAAAAAHPNDLDPVLRLFFYYEQSGDRDGADRELLEWQTRRAASHSPLMANELKTTAALFERAGDYDESARASYLLYELDSASSAEKEGALSELISLLLDVPEQPLHFGRRDLSLYRNIGQMDRHPGFLNGILSLALNTTFPQYEYQNASQTAAAYFHRASASKLIEKMKQQFPKSAGLPALESKLFAAYAVYGQDDALIRLVPTWLTANRNAPQYIDNALLLADAYFRAKRSTDEFTLYDRLLQTIATRTDHVPIGPEAGQNVRSPDYVRVLDRYLSRLTEAQRRTEAIALYKREIVRNPGDPGLYERLALFVEQNRLDDQLAETYRAAFARFKDASWADKLARLYLRRKQYTNYEALLRQITSAFEGTELARFLTAVSPNANITPVLYRQVNLYAHHRFPHNLTFVRNLLRAYQVKATADPAAYEQLLRENWFYDAALRSAFFEYLTRTGKLRAELSALPATDAAAQQGNIAAIQMRAEGSAWLANFEASAPAFARLAGIAPGDRASNARAISIERSLSAGEPAAFMHAIHFAEQDVKAAPGDSATVARVGEIYADRELYAQASPWWNRVAAIHPGLTSGYLESATIFWDYFRYADALRMITEARNAFRQPSLFAYEAGAIYENQSDFAPAIDEYIRAALEQPATGRNALAQDRLLTLAGRRTIEKLVEERSASLMNGAFDARKLQLRIAILEKENRTAEIRTLLDSALARAPSVADADQIRQSAAHFGFDSTEAAALARMIGLTQDPVEKIKARVDLAIFQENHNNISGAEHDLNTLLAENRTLLGVVRASVDFYYREKQYAKAVSTLTQAADRAVEPYREELRSEAAQKAVDGGDYRTARTLLDQLLAQDPFNADLLARKADTFARENDTAALTSFYDAELKALQNSSFASTEKTNRIAGLRRGYIPSLITAQRFADALEQYQQLLNSFPEDEALTGEAARFAAKHDLADRLVAYYSKATEDSPKNYRWPLLLARIDRILGRYLDALAAYEKAVYVRPDRADIFAAKADLEMRLERFDAALKTNEKLYDLSYHDTRYLAEQAAIQARLGNRSEAVRLLRSAHLDREPKDIAGYFMVMRRLLAWRMFSEAESIYREMRPLVASNPDLARDAVSMELQTLTSLHRFHDAVAAAGWAARNIKDFAASGDAARFSRAIGDAVREYFTPEEKSQVAAQIGRPDALPAPLRTYDLANAAGLFDIAASALASSANGWMRLRELQDSRLAFTSLGRTAENFARQSRQEEKRREFLSAALDAYAKAGDSTAALRVSMALMRGDAIDPRRFAALFVKSGGAVSSLAAHA